MSRARKHVQDIFIFIMSSMRLLFNPCLSSPLSAPADVVLSAFHNLSHGFPNSTVPPAELRDLVSECFEEPGTEFEPWTPSDWHDKWDPAVRRLVTVLFFTDPARLARVNYKVCLISRPKFLEGIADGVLRDWAEKMHSPWKFLCRKVTLTIKA